MKGKGVSSGIAIGQLQFYKRMTLQVENRRIADVQEELLRFERARALAAMQLGELAVTTAQKIGQQNSLLFEIHQMMLEDIDYRESVIDLIQRGNSCAEYAVYETARIFGSHFSEMDDDYMKERAADVTDVSRRVIEILQGTQQKTELGTSPTILVSDDFTPSETAQFEREQVLGLATTGGSGNSHTAIFARTLGIPAVIGLGLCLHPALDGKMVILDGDTGELVIEPDDETLQRYMNIQNQQQLESTLLQQYVGMPTISKSGKVIRLYANIGSPSDLESVQKNDAEGIGLFRSEFLYLEQREYPSEEMQFQAYKTVLEGMSTKPVIVRTLDIGADKQADYFNLPHEENPALGMRAIRICLTWPEVFKTQLRALYRASVHGKLKIMFPLITSLDEVYRIKKIVSEVKDTLNRENIPYDMDVPLGIMIETPAAAIISDLLAKEVDFFSIGTNDLTQYTLAIDRQNTTVESFFDAKHEALLRLIKAVVDNAHSNGIWVGLCGELASDVTLTGAFLSMGVDELSVVPSAILPLRKSLCEID